MTKKITIKEIQELRERTGAGMMDCRKALEEAAGDMEKAIENLRKKGAALAVKRAGKTTAEGVVASYIHPGDRVGVLLEVNCETDFVARTPEFKKFVDDLAMHIAALKPLYLAPEDVDPKFLEHEKDIIREQLAESGKPAEVINKIVEGKLGKLYSEVCLLEQPYVKNDQLTVAELVKEMVGKTGENIKINRFARFEIGS